MVDESVEQMKSEFVADASGGLDRLSRKIMAMPREGPYPGDLTNSLFRTAHSLKGTAGMFGLDEASRLAGSLETLLEAMRAGRIQISAGVLDLIVEVLDGLSSLLREASGAGAGSIRQPLHAKMVRLLEGPAGTIGPRSAGADVSSSALRAPSPTRPTATEDTAGGVAGPAALAVKVDIALLDSIMNTISELFSTRLALSGVARRLPRNRDTRRLGDDLLKISYLLNKRMLDLEASVIEARLVPVSMLFDRYSSETRRLARQAGKDIELVCEGEATRVDRALLDKFYDPLLHLIRNAVDHGIEPSVERARIGKSRRGQIVLRAREESSHLVLEVEDDGRGVDLERVRQVAASRGITAQDREAALQLLFRPGFSTKEAQDEISGRGVGLDAVKTQVEALRGIVSVTTEAGRGTRVSIWVPQTLAVSRGMLVREGGVPAAIPLGSVVEVLRATEQVRDEAGRTGRIVYGGSAVGAADLSAMLGTRDNASAKSIVVLGIGGKLRAILVDEVCGETEILSRPLPEALVAPNFISGATELHDGRPAIVIQPGELLACGTGIDAAACRPGAPPKPRTPGAMRQFPGEPLRCVVLRRGARAFAIAMSEVQQVLSPRGVCEVPVLGRAWDGIFFVRGVCHGLLRLPDEEGFYEKTGYKMLILESPARCGICIDEVMDTCEVPATSFAPLGPAGMPDVLGWIGAFPWRGKPLPVLGGAGSRERWQGEAALMTCVPADDKA
jgi:two-component system, chemotaxis family, sensor kinase CheA